MTLDLLFAMVGNIYTECSIIVILKLRFLTSNLIFLFTYMNFSGQDAIKMDSLSPKRQGI